MAAPAPNVPDALPSANPLPFVLSFTDFIMEEFSRNSLPAYLTAAGMAIIGAGLILLLRGFISRKLTHWIHTVGRYGKIDRGMAAQTVNSLISVLPLLPVYSALTSLTFSKNITSAINILFLWLFTFVIVRFLADLATFLLDIFFRGSEWDRDTPASEKGGAGPLKPIIRAVVWGLGITFLLDNLGFQVSSIVAGLGIIGVAVGLAGQAILADFFSYLVIIMDKPFTIGDTVSFGDTTGTIEHIGLRTTRLRALTGELLICPNGDLAKQRVGNYHESERRRRTLAFGVTYETPVRLLRAIPDIVREEAAKLDCDLLVDRVHFLAFGDSALNYELAVSVPGNVPILRLLDAVQALNLALIERFADENIAFAYPTQTLYVSQAAARTGDAPLRHSVEEADKV